MTYRMAALFAAAALAAGCLASETPLPPDEALSTAATRIEALMRSEREHARPERSALAEDPAPPENASEVEFWYFSHPLVAPVAGMPSWQADFARKTGVELKAQFIGEWQFAIQKLSVSLAAGDLPDVAIVKRGWVPRLLEAGRIYPLNDYLTPALRRDFLPEVYEQFSVDGTLAALPVDGFCSVLLYNKDVLGDTAPANWEELRARAKNTAWNDQAKPDRRYAIGYYPYLEALWSAGGGVCRGVSCGLRDNPASETLAYILSLRDAGHAHPRALQDPSLGLSLFMQQHVAMTVVSSAELMRLRDLPFPIGIAPVPGKSGPISRLSDNALVVFAGHAAAKQDAVCAFIDALTGLDVTGGRAVDNGSVPPRKSVREATPPRPGLAAAYKVARGAPLVSVWNAAEAEMYRYLGLAYRWKPQ